MIFSNMVHYYINKSDKPYLMLAVIDKIEFKTVYLH